MTELTMKTRVNNLEHRMDRVEQILPTLATKTDLERFATKADLERFATKEELQRAVSLLATQEELQRAVSLLATKEELQRAVSLLATKEELRSGLDEVRRHALVLHEDLKSDISLLAEHLSAVMQRIERRR